MNKVVIEMKEWEEKLPEKGCVLYKRFLDEGELVKQTANKLSKKGILQITELKNGLSLSTNSYVGRISIGSIQVNIRPKLNGMPLYKLLRYAYGLRDLEILSRTHHNIEDFPFCDLLIHQLCVEVEELLTRGLNRKYTRVSNELQVLRGQIDIRVLANRGGAVAAALPCIYFERIENNLLNQVLLAGLKLGIKLTEDLSLRIKLNRLCGWMGESVIAIALNRNILLKALRSVDRLTQNYKPALEIINILFESQGIQLEDGSMQMQLHGFMFDMNRFFQSLLSKLLHEYLNGYELLDEYSLHDMFSYTPGFNPQRRRAPTPRPDFAVMKSGEVVCLLDAKYRDLWEKSFPREMLYQLTIYAVSGKDNKTSKILYPTMNVDARVQKIDIKNPATGEIYAKVVLQPVLLYELAELIEESKKNSNVTAEYVKKIVFS